MAQTLIAIGPEELQQLVRDAVKEALGTAPPQPPPRYVDKTAIAHHFGVSRATVHVWVHEQGCPHILKGKVLRFEVAAVEDWFRGRQAGKLRAVP